MGTTSTNLSPGGSGSNPSAGYGGVERRAIDAERLAHDRAALLSIAAHDLRTPLSGLLGYVECLAMRAGADAGAAWLADDLGVVADQLKLTLDLLADLLDRQAAESGRLPLSLEWTDMSLFLRETAAVYRTWAGPAERRVEVRLDEPLPRMLVDRLRVRQILNNLAHNALKHTPRGKAMTIEANRIGDAHVEFAIANEGAGFAPSDTDRMLGAFERGTSLEPPVGKGHGLGLAIVDRLVRLHGGKLLAEGKPGRGARFAFVLAVAGVVQRPEKPVVGLS